MFMSTIARKPVRECYELTRTAKPRFLAKSLSTEYVRSEAQKLEDDDEDRGEDNGPEYVSYSGTEFDSRLEFPHERLTEFGMLEEEAKWFWGTRIAVDKAEQF
jgi:hypothetical protein